MFFLNMLKMSMSDQEEQMMMMMTTAAPAPMMPPMTGTIFMLPRRTVRDVSKMDPPSDDSSESSTYHAQDKRYISPVHEDECANSRIFPGSIHSEGNCGTPDDAAQQKAPEDVTGVFREMEDSSTPEIYAAQHRAPEDMTGVFRDIEDSSTPDAAQQIAPEDVEEAAPTYLDWAKDNDHEDDLQVNQKRSSQIEWHIGESSRNGVV
ncbi:unnamed protein product [Timema podura]|uniref:Uncharacterized protein n=1 Tax=Timema podura TaxID=61482 RepID=A0ABN7PFN8_TIMPD|nr:unnamed protein product [Timema podura]